MALMEDQLTIKVGGDFSDFLKESHKSQSVLDRLFATGQRHLSTQGEAISRLNESLRTR